MAASPAPLVSVVIPCFLSTREQADLLKETLQTVALQTWRSYEVVLVDDGSPIDPHPIAAPFAQTRVCSQRNAGSALARNTGIAASRGDFLVFLDADDHLLPEALATGLRELAEHPECGFAIGPREEMQYDGSPVTWGVPVPPDETQVYRSLLAFEWYIIPPSSAMFRREVVQRVGRFQNPWGADDLDFYLRVARDELARCYQSPPVTRYRRYSASSSRDGERMLASIRKVYRRQWPLVQGNSELTAAYESGLSRLVEIFRGCLVENFRDRLRQRQWRRAARALARLAQESPARFLREVKSLAAEIWPGRRPGETFIQPSDT